jgi:hypothetical protein
MADSEGTFGGDGSVAWVVRAVNAKPGTPKQVPPVHSSGAVRHEGQDASVVNANFRISLRIPQTAGDRTVLQNTLTAAAAAVGASAPGSWTGEILLAIEDTASGHKPAGADEQIKVKWQST